MSFGGPSAKPEWPPLLAVGFYPMSLDDLRELCVDRFPASGTRNTIMDGLEAVVRILRAVRLPGEVWVDGSFLTQKTDPVDVDFVVRVDRDFIRNYTPAQVCALNWLNLDLKGKYCCDSYAFLEYPQGDPEEAAGRYWYAYWRKHFCRSRRKLVKGIASVQL